MLCERMADVSDAGLLGETSTSLSVGERVEVSILTIHNLRFASVFVVMGRGDKGRSV